MRQEAEWVCQQVREHHRWFSESLPMIASENLISPLARELMICDFCDRYAEGLPGERYYQGNVYVDRVELKAIELARKLFKAEHADVRPISGTVANMAVLFGLAKPGDTITTPALSDGAHISTAKFGAVGLRGLNPVTYPFDTSEMVNDLEGTAKLLREVKPKLALFGQSVFLFPVPLRELADVFQEVGCYVWYDAAHVLGLIAGGRFQDPLREGAELMTGSTHKTLPGPQHGILLANPRDEKMKRSLERGVFPGVVSNHHLNAVAALAVTLAEHMVFGEAYADQVISNARALGQALHEEGFKVLCEHKGFTASHTLAVDVTAQGGGAEVALELEKANIIVNNNLLPWDTKPKSPSGIRLGSQELTRLGMKEGEMRDVARLIGRVAIGKEPPEKVKEYVAELRRQFSTIHYCFEEGTEAYQYYHIV